MVETANSHVDTEKVDSELEYLKKKSAQGTMNVIGDVLADPEIKKTIMRKVAMPLIAVACLFIGALGFFDVIKQILGLGWREEIVISASLVLIGLIYLLKNMLIGKKHDN